MTQEIKHYRPADPGVNLFDRMNKRRPTSGRIVCLKRLEHGAKYIVDREADVIIDNSQKDSQLSVQHYNPVVVERTKSYLEKVLGTKLDEITERNPDSQNP